MKRVVFLHLNDYMFPIPRVHIMAEALHRNGYDIHVICTRSGKISKEVINGVTIWDASFNLDNKNKEKISEKLQWLYSNLKRIPKNPGSKHSSS